MTTRSDFFLALRQARIATHRGDVAATERWLRICERYLDVVRGYEKLSHTEVPVVGRPRRPW
jgi:hypothetical protein